MNARTSQLVALLVPAAFATLAVAQAPFTAPPLQRAVPAAPQNLGGGQIGWVENFNRPDGTRQWTDLTGSQSTVGWSNRAQDSNFANDSGYMGTFGGKFFFTGYSEDGLAAPSAFVRNGLLDQIGVGAGSNTSAFSVGLDVSFGAGDWSFAGPGLPGFPGGQIGFLDMAVETANSGGAAVAQRPRLNFNPAGELQIIGAAGGTSAVSSSTVASTLGKNLNSTDSFRLLMTFDAADDSIKVWVDDTLFLDATFDNVGGLADFLDISRIEMQTGSFRELGLPNDSMIGNFNYDNLVITNFVATPDQITSIIPEPASLVLLASASLLLRRRA